MGSAWNRNITPASVLRVEKLLVEAFRLIFHMLRSHDRLVDLRRSSPVKLRITMAAMLTGAVQLSERPSSLWAEGGAVNANSFKIKGLLVMSIVA